MTKPRRKSSRKQLVWGSIAAAFSVFVVFTTLITYTYLKHQTGKPFQAGVSFSAPYARQLSLDPKQTMAALTDDLKVRHFRLMSYWDVGEPKSGNYDFGELDWQMKLAEQSHSTVSLAVGLRQPRWPECHQPDWAKSLPVSEQRTKLAEYMVRVVDRYKTSPALVSYQLENEALNTAFGDCPKATHAGLVQEFNLVKQHDPNHPIIISVSNEYGLPLGAPRGDEVGLSIYHRVFDSTITHRYVEYPIPAWYHLVRAAYISFLISRETVIHELQAEPWGPGPVEQLSIAEQSKSMDVNRLKSRVGYAKATGIRDFDLWGAEWWYYRKVKFNDPSLWEAAKPFFGPDLQTKKCCSI